MVSVHYTGRRFEFRADSLDFANLLRNRNLETVSCIKRIQHFVTFTTENEIYLIPVFLYFLPVPNGMQVAI